MFDSGSHRSYVCDNLKSRLVLSGSLSGTHLARGMFENKGAKLSPHGLTTSTRRQIKLPRL